MKKTTIKIYKQYDGQKEIVYSVKNSIAEALELLNFIKNSCEILIGAGKLGFYAKATKNFSTPFSMRISKK
jgi:hypothetical protein